MSNITRDQAEAAYLRSSATCPFCGGDILADEMTGDGDCQHQETYCEGCGATFVETYRLESVTIEGGPTENVEGMRELVE